MGEVRGPPNSQIVTSARSRSTRSDTSGLYVAPKRTMSQSFGTSASNWTATATSNPDLPAELLDHIVDFLRDDTEALKTCCLTSKSWIPRTRKHLFADVNFDSPTRLQAWKNKFPNPSTSPACYTKSLFLSYQWNLAHLADAEEGGWIPTFSQIEYLMIKIEGWDISLVPFHGISPVLKSLSIDCIFPPLSPTSNLICSFPLLEDLSVEIHYDSYRDHHFHGQLAASRPSSSPVFTGYLQLSVSGAMHHIAYGLLSLPGGLHFQALILVVRSKEDILSATALVEECSPTLEYLELDCEPGMSVSPHVYDNSLPPLIVDESPDSIDLSKATRLRHAVFICKSDPRLITMALRTITRNHRNFKRLSIGAPKTLGSRVFTPRRLDLANIKHAVGEAGYLGWLELDRLLAQLHESRSIHLNVLIRGGGQEVRGCMEHLLPEVVTVGIGWESESGTEG